MACEIREGIKQAFTRDYTEIQSAAFEEWPELTTFGCDQITASLATNLYRYRRPIDDRFLSWAKAWVQRETRRHRFLSELFTQTPELVYAAVERSLFRSVAEDFAVEPCDHLADIYAHLLKYPRKIDALMKPERAKPTTMLYALTKSRMRAFRRQISKRHAKIDKHIAIRGELGCETVTSPEEKSEILSAV